MGLRHVGIEFNSVAGLFTDSEVSVLKDRAVVYHEILPPVDVPREFVNPEVAHRRGSVCRSDGADRAGGIVRGGGDVVVVSQIVNALRFEQTAKFREYRGARYRIPATR